MEHSPSCIADNSSASQEISHNVIRMFIIVFTKVRHLNISRARVFKTTHSHPLSLRPSIILHSNLSLGLPSGLHLSAIPTTLKPCMHRLPHMFYTPRLFNHASFQHLKNHEVLTVHTSRAFSYFRPLAT